MVQHLMVVTAGIVFALSSFAPSNAEETCSTRLSTCVNDASDRAYRCKSRCENLDFDCELKCDDKEEASVETCKSYQRECDKREEAEAVDEAPYIPPIKCFGC